MPNPKRQHAKARGRTRRTHWKARVASLSPCSQCQKLIIPHRVCPFCGYYKSKIVVEIQSKEKKTEEK